MVFSDRQWKLVLFVLLIVLVPAIIISYLQFGSVGLNALSILATSLLTLALVGLYREQHVVLKRQQEPLLEVSDVRIDRKLQSIKLEISNFGGGPATSLRLRIDLYELDGTGPIKKPRGDLHRIESASGNYGEKTRSSSIQPREPNISFEAVSKGHISMGGSGRQQESLASILTQLLNEDRSVVYGRIVIEYSTKYSGKEEYDPDFSVKFFKRDSLEYELMDFLPWERENTIRSFGA